MCCCLFCPYSDFATSPYDASCDAALHVPHRCTYWTSSRICTTRATGHPSSFAFPFPFSSHDQSSGSSASRHDEHGEYQIKNAICNSPLFLSINYCIYLLYTPATRIFYSSFIFYLFEKEENFQFCFFFLMCYRVVGDRITHELHMMSNTQCNLPFCYKLLSESKIARCDL